MNGKTRSLTSKLHWARYRLKNNPTDAESLFRKYLDEFKIPYYFQKGMITSKKRGRVRILDFYISRVKIVFEIDGAYHDNLNQQIKDFEREQEVQRKRRGVLFVRFKNEDVIKNPDQVKHMIKEAYNDRLIDILYIQNKRFGIKTREKYKILQ